MDTDIYTVYVIQLNNGLRYLYSKKHNIDNISIRDLFLEFRYFTNMFDYQYYPKELLRTYNNVISYNINGLVLSHMHVYGIEHVRGGKYNQMILSDYDKEEISNHIKYFANDLFEQEDKIEKYNKYMQEYNSFTLEELYTERSRINNFLFEYNKCIDLYRKLNVVEREDLNRIAWLRDLCEKSNNNFQKEDYDLFMARMRFIFVSFKTYYENADIKIESLRKHYQATDDPCIFLYDPSCFFDKLVFEHSSREKYIVDIPFVFSLIDLVFYSMRNKCNELDFEMNAQECDENMERNLIITNILKPLSLPITM